MACAVNRVRARTASDTQEREMLCADHLHQARGDIPMAVRAIQGGAVDFLTKPVNEAALFNSVEKAFEQERASRREASEQEAFAARYATLTRRERQVLVLLVRGL